MTDYPYDEKDDAPHPDWYYVWLDEMEGKLQQMELEEEARRG